jgi:hypothetical protein
MKLRPLALALAVASGSALAATDDMAALKAELQRLSARLAALEQHNKEMEKALASERVSEQEPELATRLKAVEFQALSMQKQARQIEALEGITVGASLTGVVQKTNRQSTALNQPESRANYRGDVSVTLPGGEMGDIEGKIFTHVRFGQGNGIGLRPTYTSGPNTTAFQVAGNPAAPTPADDSFAILAQAWYQLAVPLPRDGIKGQSKERLLFTFGKIDPFVFFDQNAAADDESSKFMNNVFVHNPLLDSGGDTGADSYGFAPGAIVQYVNEHEKTRTWALSLGAFGSGPGANFSGSTAKPFVIAQADTTWRFNYLPGNYRIYTWHNGRGQDYDGVESSHAGWGMSVDQKVAATLTLFGRYGSETSRRVRFDRAVTSGIEIGGADWGRAADALGLALGSLRTAADFRRDAPTDPNFGYAPQGWERQAELYYRYRVNGRFELSPNFQLIWNAAGDASAPLIKVVGMRAKVGF